jgi:hypothetical protein
MKIVIWLLGVAAIGVFVYGLVKWRRTKRGAAAGFGGKGAQR